MAHQRAQQILKRSEGGVCWLGGRKTDRAAETAIAGSNASGNTIYSDGMSLSCGGQKGDDNPDK